MAVMSPDEYVKRRERYDYRDPECRFEVGQTGALHYVGEFQGIYPGTLPPNCPKAVNLRKFETICQEVFDDCSHAHRNGSLTSKHIANMKSITGAVVHWKMASQGGRADVNVNKVQEGWTDDTVITLMQAYDNKDMGKFRIGRVAIPTATAFMRFLFPGFYGIVDSRVAPKTNNLGITQFSLSKHKTNKNYISNIPKNIRQYTDAYTPFLRKEAQSLNNAGARFHDVDSLGATVECTFRPCDVEMALWEGD
ncbi:MAG: hypothetical protein HYS38_10250 [Acidobacteria bacterium]|nr:hypothetical protein [Acidobacteriota bacterium]